MTSLTFSSYPKGIFILNELENKEVESWHVSHKHGTMSGITASVSGAGAWVKLTGDATFTAKSLKSSKTYEHLKETYKFGGGISGFWSWLGFGGGGQKEKSKVRDVFKEVSSSQSVTAKIHIEMEVTSPYPGFQVDASAYVSILEVKNDSGDEFQLMSPENPADNIGAKDQNGDTLPQKDNGSTLTF